MIPIQIIVSLVMIFLLSSLYKRIFVPGFTFVIGITVLAVSGIYIITETLSSVITNIGVVAIVFPITLTLVQQLDVNPKPFVFLIAYAAAASFITPIGYHTNLMVYGPVGYNFKDSMKIGLPSSIIFMIVAAGVLTLKYNLHLN